MERLSITTRIQRANEVTTTAGGPRLQQFQCGEHHRREVGGHRHRDGLHLGEARKWRRDKYVVGRSGVIRFAPSRKSVRSLAVAISGPRDSRSCEKGTLKGTVFRTGPACSSLPTTAGKRRTSTPTDAAIASARTAGEGGERMFISAVQSDSCERCSTSRVRRRPTRSTRW